MNNRERLLAILDHRPPDRIPWIPRLQPWYDARVLSHSLPAAWEGLSLREVEHKLGVGTPAREGRIFKTIHDGLEVVQRKEDGKDIVEYHTPVGMVRSVSHTSDELESRGLSGRIEEYLLKGPPDYRVWEWITEHTRWEPDYEAYRAYDAAVGGDGLPMVQVHEVPLHNFLLDLAGYGDSFYQLADYPKEVEHLLRVMTEVHREQLWPVILNSPARLLLHGAHLSSQFTPPALFEKFILPTCTEIFAQAHAAGKAIAMHADNDTSQIIELLERAGWDMLECFVTAPMVPLTLEHARQVLGKRVILWGGLPSILFSPSVSELEFREYVYEVLKTIAPGDAFILGIADMAMPDSLIERVAWVSEVVEEQGHYPIK